MKKTLLLFVALCCTAVANAENPHATYVDGIYYIINENHTAIVTWGGTSSASGTDCYSGNIVIPDSILMDKEYYQVTGIGSYAFKNCNELCSISLPTKLQNIGEYAFNGCNKINTISFPDGLICIGGYAFSDCTGLNSVSLPEGLERIGMNAFEDCTGLSSISLPEGLASIGNSAFLNCTSLTTVAIPTTVKYINDAAFRGTTNLEEVFVYSDSLTEVGSGAWSKEIPTYVKSIVFKKYKANVLKNYNVRILPDDGNIGDAIKTDFNFSEEETEVINRLLRIRNSMGNRQSGPAIEIEDNDGETIQLYNVKNVKFIKVSTEE